MMRASPRSIFANNKPLSRRRHKAPKALDVDGRMFVSRLRRTSEAL